MLKVHSYYGSQGSCLGRFCLRPWLTQTLQPYFYFIYTFIFHSFSYVLSIILYLRPFFLCVKIRPFLNTFLALSDSFLLFSCSFLYIWLSFSSPKDWRLKLLFSDTPPQRQSLFHITGYWEITKGNFLLPPWENTKEMHIIS